MKEIAEKNIYFKFPEDLVIKYDETDFYQKFKTISKNTKGIDFIYIENDIVWLIEVKDYQKITKGEKIYEPKEIEPSKLSENIAMKVKDTMAGILCLKYNNEDDDMKLFLEHFLLKNKLKVVFHLEQEEKYEGFKPIDPADIKHKLKRLLRKVDPNVYVVNHANLTEYTDINWSVEIK